MNNIKIKDPFQEYERNKNLMNLQQLKLAENYIMFKITNIPLKSQDIIKDSLKMLGYYLKPQYVYDFLREIIINADKIKEILPEKELIPGIIKELTYEIKESIDENNISLNCKNPQKNVYHIVTSFKNAPMALDDLKIFLHQIRNHCKAKKAKVVFYMADAFYKDVPNMTTEEFKYLEHMLMTLQGYKELLVRIGKKNKLFKNILKKYNMVYENINKYTQKFVSPLVIDSVENTRDFVDAEQFKAFLDSFCKDKNIIYKVIAATSREKILKILHKGITSNILFLNVGGLLQYYKKDTYDDRQTYTIHESSIIDNLDLLVRILEVNTKPLENNSVKKNKKTSSKDIQEDFIAKLEKAADFKDLLNPNLRNEIIPVTSYDNIENIKDDHDDT